jgi:hypothetical protein
MKPRPSDLLALGTTALVGALAFECVRITIATFRVREMAMGRGPMIAFGSAVMIGFAACLYWCRSQWREYRWDLRESRGRCGRCGCSIGNARELCPACGFPIGRRRDAAG